MEEKPNSGKQTGSLKWHPAFLQAMQMELADYQDALEKAPGD